MKLFLTLLLGLISLPSYGAWGTIVDVVAEYQAVHVATPVCHYQEVRSRPNQGTFIGALIGGATGLAVGSGSGQVLATAVGAATGAIIGRDYASSTKVNTVCVNTFVTQHQRSGYRVTVELNGAQYPMFLHYNPGVGARIPLIISPR